ncbi:MAG: protoporphyrinogen oxidase [Terriglobales bacterium]
MTPNTTQIVVVGAGISGLAAAWALRQAGCDCLVLEAQPRCGGSIQTGHEQGFIYEGGPDSFLALKPAAAGLCQELGLADELIGTEPQRGGPRLLHRGRLQPLPRGLSSLAPKRLGPLLRSPLFSLTTKAALAWHWRARGESAAAPPGEDESVATYLQRRYGRRAGHAFAATITGPLLAGVYGGTAAQISAARMQPRRAVARITLAPAPPLFLSLRSGMGTLVETLAARLQGSVRLRCRVRFLAPASAGYRLELESGESLAASAVILALPAPAAATLLAPLDAALSAPLAAIPTTSSVNLNLGFRSAPPLPPGHGFLADSSAAPLLACTFAHQKFAGRALAGGALLRLFYGPALAEAADAALADRALADLATILHITAAPDLVRMRHSYGALPLYSPGHATRLRRLTEALAHHPLLALAGNAYDGVGVPDCIASGRAAAARVLAALA